MSYASVVCNSGREVLPIRQFKTTLDNAESGFQVRVSLIILGSHDRVSTRDELRAAPSASSQTRLRWIARWRRTLALSQALFLSLEITTGRLVE